jgi:hypothetical protein
MQTHPQTQATFTMPAKPHQFVASDRVEGTLVRRSDGTKIGTIERLMIDKVSGKVAYAVLGFGGFMGVGVKHMPVPWDRMKYAVALDAYEINLSDEELARAPLFEGDEEFDWLPRRCDRQPQLLSHAALLRQDVRFRGQSGHGFLRRKCLLMTQSGY